MALNSAEQRENQRRFAELQARSLSTGLSSQPIEVQAANSTQSIKAKLRTPAPKPTPSVMFLARPEQLAARTELARETQRSSVKLSQAPSGFLAGRHLSSCAAEAAAADRQAFDRDETGLYAGTRIS